MHEVNCLVFEFIYTLRKACEKTGYGKVYSTKSHNTTKGRIDGMKKLYSENDIVLGDKLKATYISELKEIHLEKLN